MGFKSIIINNINNGVKCDPGSILRDLEFRITKNILMRDSYILSNMTSENIYKINNGIPPDDVKITRIKRGIYNLFGEVYNLQDVIKSQLILDFDTTSDDLNAYQDSCYIERGGIITAISQVSDKLKLNDSEWWLIDDNIKLLDIDACNKLSNGSVIFSSLSWDKKDNPLFGLFDHYYDKNNYRYYFRPKIPRQIINLIDKNDRKIYGFLKLNDTAKQVDGTYSYKLYEQFKIIKNITLIPDEPLFQYGTGCAIFKCA